MKRKLFIILSVVLLSIGTNVINGQPNVAENKYDICELFMDNKPIISYDLMFGDIIKASSFLVKDRKQPCINYSYTYDKSGRMLKKVLIHTFSGLQVERGFSYFENGLISEVVEQRDNFKKRISFFYDKENKICEVHETVIKGAEDPLFLNYDYLKYKMDKRGNIIEVRAIKEKMLGLSFESKFLKAYDYDETNRLKAIRDFVNPEETQIFSYDDYVNK